MFLFCALARPWPPCGDVPSISATDRTGTRGGRRGGGVSPFTLTLTSLQSSRVTLNQPKIEDIKLNRAICSHPLGTGWQSQPWGFPPVDDDDDDDADLQRDECPEGPAFPRMRRCG